jgi:hypothetical protein
MSNNWSGERMPRRRSWRKEGLLLKGQMVVHRLPMKVVATEVATVMSPFDLVDEFASIDCSHLVFYYMSTL